MSKVVKLKVKNKNQWGKSLILPGIGETKVQEDGVMEVNEESIASLLLNNTDLFELVEGNGTTVIKELHPTEAKKVVEDEESDEDTIEDSDIEDDNQDDESGEDELELEEKTLKELIEIAKEAEIPEEDYAKFQKNKKLMLAFLKKEL